MFSFLLSFLFLLCPVLQVARSDVSRLFREDSVATKWTSRVVKRSLPAIARAIGDSVKHVMFGEQAARAVLVFADSFSGTLAVDDLPNSLVIMHGLFAATTSLDLPLELRAALAATRAACTARGVAPLPVCSRLLLLRWIGPLLLAPAALVGIEGKESEFCSLPLFSRVSVWSASGEQLEQLKIASKLLVHLGEGSAVAADSPLAIFGPWLLSVQDLWREFVCSCW